MSMYQKMDLKCVRILKIARTPCNSLNYHLNQFIFGIEEICHIMAAMDLNQGEYIFDLIRTEMKILIGAAEV